MSYPSNKRIAYVMKRYPRYSETFIVNEILAHEAAGMDIEIFSLRSPEDTHFQDGIARIKAPVNYLPPYTPKTQDFWQAIVQAGKDLPALWRELPNLDQEAPRELYQAIVLAQALHKKGITHIHAHFASLATSVARMAALFAGIGYSFTAHAKDIFHEDVIHKNLRTKLRDASFCITVSDFNLKYLRQSFGTDADHVLRLYNGLDLERFPYHSPQQRPAHIIAVGRLVEKKGFNDLISACAILAKRQQQFSCTIIGTGKQEAALREQIHQLNLESTVTLLGPRPLQDIIQHIHNAAVFAAPCVVAQDGNRDGLPTVLLESMALGTPSISTDVTGIPEIVKHDETGLMVPQHDPESLADALERLLEAPALREKLARQARKLIESQFDIQQNTTQLREWFVSGGLTVTKNQQAS